MGSRGTPSQATDRLERGAVVRAPAVAYCDRVVFEGDALDAVQEDFATRQDRGEVLGTPRAFETDEREEVECEREAGAGVGSVGRSGSVREVGRREVVRGIGRGGLTAGRRSYGAEERPTGSLGREEGVRVLGSREEWRWQRVVGDDLRESTNCALELGDRVRAIIAVIVVALVGCGARSSLQDENIPSDATPVGESCSHPPPVLDASRPATQADLGSCDPASGLACAAWAASQVDYGVSGCFFGTALDGVARCIRGDNCTVERSGRAHCFCGSDPECAPHEACAGQRRGLAAQCVPVVCR